MSDRKKGKNFYYSHLEKLKEEKIINKEFENIISRLTLEDLITAKLEVTAWTGRKPPAGIKIVKSQSSSLGGKDVTFSGPENKLIALNLLFIFITNSISLLLLYHAIKNKKLKLIFEIQPPNIFRIFLF